MYRYVIGGMCIIGGEGIGFFCSVCSVFCAFSPAAMLCVCVRGRPVNASGGNARL